MTNRPSLSALARAGFARLYRGSSLKATRCVVSIVCLGDMPLHFGHDFRPSVLHPAHFFSWSVGEVLSNERALRVTGIGSLGVARRRGQMTVTPLHLCYSPSSTWRQRLFCLRVSTAAPLLCPPFRYREQAYATRIKETEVAEGKRNDPTPLTHTYALGLPTLARLSLGRPFVNVHMVALGLAHEQCSI